MRNHNKQLLNKRKIATIAAIAALALSGGAKAFESGSASAEHAPPDKKPPVAAKQLGAKVMKASRSEAPPAETNKEPAPLDEQASALASKLAEQAGSVISRAQSSDPESVSITRNVQPNAPEGGSNYTRTQFTKDGFFITIDYLGDSIDASNAKMVSLSYAKGEQSDFLTIQTEQQSSQDWMLTEQRHVGQNLSSPAAGYAAYSLGGAVPGTQQLSQEAFSTFSEHANEALQIIDQGTA